MCSHTYSNHFFQQKLSVNSDVYNIEIGLFYFALTSDFLRKEGNLYQKIKERKTNFSRLLEYEIAQCSRKKEV